MKVAKWGNSLAVRLPATLVEELNLREGDDVMLRPFEASTLEIARVAAREAALAEFDRFRGMMPDDFVFDREEANARR